jgi:translin
VNKEFNKSLKFIDKKISKSIFKLHKLREEVINSSRKIIQNSKFIVNLTHRGELKKAEKLILENEKIKEKTDVKLKSSSLLAFTGPYQDALKEYVEAEVFFKILQDKKLPTPDDLKVLETTYLRGLSEAATEIRRYILDTLRKSENGKLEEYLKIMEAIYTFLLKYNYPDALIPNLRHQTDVLRKVIEQTRSDLTFSKASQKLSKKISCFLQEVKPNA